MADIKTTVFEALKANSTLTGIVGDNIFYNVVEDVKGKAPLVLLVVSLIEAPRDLCGDVMYRKYAVNIKCVAATQGVVYDIATTVEDVTIMALNANNDTDDEPIWEEELQLFTMNVSFEVD